MSIRGAAAACAVFMLLPLLASAQVPDDSQLMASASRSIASYSRYTVFDHVQARAEAGVVTLSGKVTMAAKREEICRRIEQIDGVRSVRNDIQVLPDSYGDDALRQKVARAIYSSASFWKYAAQANPPIHIVVERGRVTLAGFVATDVDRVVAESLATGLGEISLTNALRTGRDATHDVVTR